MENRVDWLRKALVLILIVLAMSPVYAQGQPYPTLKGNNGRTGNNGSPSTSFPGLGALKWFAPSSTLGDNRGTQTTVDNGDAGASFSTNWIAPAAGSEAAGAYWPNIAKPPYLFAHTVPSDTTDPTLAFGGSGLEKATFTLSPSDVTARDYAVYVHYPDGSTSVGATTYLQALYQVVKVTPSTGGSYVDIVHVDAVGKGWVRIGNGGLDTARLFHYDGTTPITVTIYNTIPRDTNGTLLDTRANTVQYADAVRLSPDLGSYTASPTVFQLSPTDGRVISALNVVGLDTNGNTVTQGTVYSRDYQTGALRWKWSPPSSVSGQGSGSLGVTVDNTDPSVSADSVFTSDVSGTPGSYLGPDYFSATITNTPATPNLSVTYAPTLDDGNYNIYFHTVQGGTFGKNVEVDISEDGGVTFTSTTINETSAGPWVKIGTRRYNSTTSSLIVSITNYSADPTDNGKLAYADAIKFEGAITGGINSTPVQAKVFLRQTTNSIPVLTNVVLVATEQGTLFCLDANGNGDGTTKTYWSYPSFTTPDPNQIAGKDGVGPLATPPALFNTSSALVQSTTPAAYSPTVSYHYEDWVSEGGNFYISMTEPNIGVDPAGDAGHTNWAPVSDPSDATHAQDRLFIGSSNGRVYSIDMTGRGDFTSTSIGTTARCWTYPDDYPATVQPSALGAFKCSLAYGNAVDHTGANIQTIYACTAQGRVYALDATGDPTNRTTSIHWTYPALTAAPAAPFTSTPAFAYGNLYVGTAMQDNGALPGQFLCIKANSDAGATDNWGTVTWSFSGDAAAQADNFFGGPAIANAADLNAPFATTMTNTVFAANQNRYVYAFDAATGAVVWETNELNSGVQGPLTFSYLSVPYYDTVAGTFTATPTPVPVVMVPCENGHLAALYANTKIVNRVNNGTRRAYEYDMASGTVSGVACGYNYMYSVDQSGYLYAFNAVGGSFGTEVPPGNPVITENDPRYDRYASAKIRLIKPSGYQALRNGTATYTDINSGTYDLGTAGYEYGETLYAIVYNYPYDVLDKDGNGISPPIANFNLSVEGATLTSVSSNSQQLPGAPFSASVNHNLDGYALLTFTVDLAGTFSLPPGDGIVQATLTSGFNGAPQPYALSNVIGSGEQAFNIANPIAIQVRPGAASAPLAEQVGVNTDGTIPENKVNGTPSAKEHITATTGIVAHGSSGVADVQVVDRSLMTLKRGDGLGLGFVRVQRSGLGWRWPGWPSSGTATSPIYGALPSWASTFEDYPVNQPNTSRDYPDIRGDRVTVTKDPNGSPQNPIFNGVELIPPTGVNPSAPLSRVLQPTPFRFNIDVPKYQPANLSPWNDSNAGEQVAGGYTGQMIVFVDSTQAGTFDITSPKRSAYRTFYFATAVAPDQRLKMGQSVIDLKSLSGGAGFGSTSPWTTGAPKPWPSTAPDAGMYQSMDVFNFGNVNLLNVRLARGRYVTDPLSGFPNVQPTHFGSNTVDSNAYLDGTAHLFSDLDPQFWDSNAAAQFGSTPMPHPFSVKPRVGDKQPAKMSVNPRSRVTSLPLLSNPDWPAGASPKVTAIIPLGFPAGSYSHSIRVIEDTDQNGLLNVTANSPTEAYSDPTAVLKFKVAETRLTNGFSLYDLPMVDPVAVPSTAPNTFKNKQPAGLRTTDGHLVMAWISDRANPGDSSYSTSTPAYAPNPIYPSATVLNPQDRLYVAGVTGSTTQTANTSYNSLGDLSNFSPTTLTNSPWFNPRNPSDPFPKDDTEAGSLLGAASVPNSRWHHPALPVLGQVNPTGGAAFTKTWLAVVGDAKVQTASGAQDVSRIVLAPITVAGGVPTLDSSKAGYIDGDDASMKGKPSIVQLPGDKCVVFYSSGGSGQSHISYALVDASAFAGPHHYNSTLHSMDLPAGFELSGGPSVAYHYGTAGSSTKAYYEISFVGKLAGRPNTEVFLARLPADPTTYTPSASIALYPDNGSATSQRFEKLTYDGNGTFRSKGIGWDLTTINSNDQSFYSPGIYSPSQTILNLMYKDSTGALKSLVSYPVNGSLTAQQNFAAFQRSTRSLDASTGVVSYPCPVLGGQVYIDTNLGTVRFSSTAPLQNMEIYANYRPSVLRVSDANSAGHAGVSLVYDNHIADDLSSGTWMDGAANTVITSGSIDPSRFVVTYNRAASGAGQAARPYWKTMRQGVQLDRSLFLNGGVPTSLSVAGLSSGYYQYDATKGRLYFADTAGGFTLEGVTVTVTYDGLDQTTGAAVHLTEVHTIGLIDELDEAAVPMDVPVNETGLATFLDPFQAADRPPLLWMMWSSGRGNGSDLYMQTVAPLLTPYVGN